MSDKGLMGDWLSAIDAALPGLLAVRHDIHQHPELGFAEYRTQELVMAWLSERGFAPRKCAGTGVVADLHPGRPTCLAFSGARARPCDELDRKGSDPGEGDPFSMALFW